MKKRVLAIAAAAVLMLSLSTTLFAATTEPEPQPEPKAVVSGCIGGGYYGMMRDADGNFLSKEAFEANLDKAIEDGLINSEDKALFLERYDYCVESGGANMMRGGCANGMRGGGCGMGRRWA